MIKKPAYRGLFYRYFVSVFGIIYRLTKEHFYKYTFRRNTALLIKKISLHTQCMLRQFFGLAPCFT